MNMCYNVDLREPTGEPACRSACSGNLHSPKGPIWRSGCNPSIHRLQSQTQTPEWCSLQDRWRLDGPFPHGIHTCTRTTTNNRRVNSRCLMLRSICTRKSELQVKRLSSKRIGTHEKKCFLILWCFRETSRQFQKDRQVVPTDHPIPILEKGATGLNSLPLNSLEHIVK